MKLKEYLVKYNLKMPAFARRINYSRSFLVDIANGHKKPGIKLIRAIEAATGGQVTYNDLMDQKRIATNLDQDYD